MKSKGNNGSSIVGILVAAALIGLIFWFVTQMNQQAPRENSLMKDSGVDTSNYKAMLDSARKVAEDASKPKQ
jgi:hypothetical protein